LLEGSVIGDPDTHGLTLEEEKIMSGVGYWPNCLVTFAIQNDNLKLYGGSQYERLMNEFEYVAHSIEFPSTSINEVASAIGTNNTHNVPSYEAAASDIVRSKAKKVLLPMIEKVLCRCAFIMNHLFKITVSVILQENYSTFGILARYDQFMKRLSDVYENFVQQTKEECEKKTMDDFISFTSIMDWDLMNGLSKLKEEDYNYLGCTPEETKARVENIMLGNKMTTGPPRSRIIDQEAYNTVLIMSSKLFAGIRYFFTKYIRSKCSAFFLTPMFKMLGFELTEYFRKLSDDEYEVLMDTGRQKVIEREKILVLQLEKAKEQRENFKRVINDIQNFQEKTMEEK